MTMNQHNDTHDSDQHATGAKHPLSSDAAIEARLVEQADGWRETVKPMQSIDASQLIADADAIPHQSTQFSWQRWASYVAVAAMFLVAASIIYNHQNETSVPNPGNTQVARSEYTQPIAQFRQLVLDQPGKLENPLRREAQYLVSDTRKGVKYLFAQLPMTFDEPE